MSSGKKQVLEAPLFCHPTFALAGKAHGVKITQNTDEFMKAGSG
jgi:hypothetical protein